MQKELKITYHYNSGFSVRIGGCLLVFDYWEGEGRRLGQVGRLSRSLLTAYERVYVFISHAHPDHFDECVYDWAAEANVTYLVAGDMPVGKRGRRMNPGDTRELDPDVTAYAFDSTDLGVSFLVKAYGLSIFHAGDLNLWHWRQESSLREIEAAEAAFYAACEPIRAYPIDVCMFPVDPRQGLLYDAGANHFILTQKPRLFIPMHWQDRPEVAIDFARRAKTAQTEVLALTRPGEMAEICLEDGALDIHVIEPPRDVTDLPPVPVRKPARPVEQTGEDPFADTDLPVNID